MHHRLQWTILLVLSLLAVAVPLCLHGCDSSDGDGQANNDNNLPESADPTAMYTVAPASGTTATVFSFDASQSSDPETLPSALQVRWDWDSDGNYDTQYTTTKTTTHQFATPGSHRVTMQVRDSYGATDTVTKTLVVLAPV